MISVGIDVSKGKSTVCILKPYGEIVSKPFNITHTHKDLSELSSMLFRLNDEVKIVMEPEASARAAEIGRAHV